MSLSIFKIMNPNRFQLAPCPSDMSFPDTDDGEVGFNVAEMMKRAQADV